MGGTALDMEWAGAAIDRPAGRQSHERRALRILLADDHAVFRAGLRALFEREPDMVVVGEAATGEEAVASAQATQPDIVLMDVVMPGTGGLEATRRVVALGIGVRVIVLTALSQEQQLLDALEAGASGYVEKTDPVEQLTGAIRTVAEGRLFLSPNAARLVVLQRYRRAELAEDEKASAERLSGRDRQVLALLALGHSVKEIARRLAVSPEAIEARRTCLMARLGFRRRPELVEFALRTGLLAAR